MMAITITEEILKNAEDYITLSQKEGMAHYFAMACTEEVGGIMVERFPLKQQFLMGVLAQLYFGQDFNKQEFAEIDGKKISGVLECCMSRETYDEWASSHVFSQINRFAKRGDAEISDKAYRIISDHKTFSMMLQKSIDDRIKVANDPINRIKRIAETAITPEFVNGLLDQLEEIKGMALQMTEGDGEDNA